MCIYILTVYVFIMSEKNLNNSLWLIIDKPSRDKLFVPRWFHENTIKLTFIYRRPVYSLNVFFYLRRLLFKNIGFLQNWEIFLKSVPMAFSPELSSYKFLRLRPRTGNPLMVNNPAWIIYIIFRFIRDIKKGVDALR